MFPSLQTLPSQLLLWLRLQKQPESLCRALLWGYLSLGLLSGPGRTSVGAVEQGRCCCSSWAALLLRMVVLEHLQHFLSFCAVLPSLQGPSQQGPQGSPGLFCCRSLEMLRC